MAKRVIAVFTGNRAEYGLQYPILRAIRDHPALEYRLLVSGAHLERDFGLTLDEIKNDGFSISSEIRIHMGDDPRLYTATAIGTGILSICEALRRIDPAILVVYADRFEGFAAVIAATQMNIPTAHIEGGDLTEGGALDDSVRHAMSKLSHIHFTTHQEASDRLIAMGEESWRVHTVGFPAIDLIFEKGFAKPDEIVKELPLDLNEPILLFTQHPITTEYEFTELQISNSLAAISNLAADGVQVIMTYPNNDSGSKVIVEKLNKLNERGLKNIHLRKSLGRRLYHGILALARNRESRIACVGNSSSGIKETPAFGCPTVNIGSRQLGRLRGGNVIDVDYDRNHIICAVRRCFEDRSFREKCFESVNPYNMGGAGNKVAEVLSTIPIDRNLLRKRHILTSHREKLVPSYGVL